ncbi:MAG: small multi-drug export protein [Dehalococcoidia bacterium]|nr:small multi-drug export protein [Dehalococcoidia bacterium]
MPRFDWPFPGKHIMTREIAWVLLFTVLPISELRVGIPLGILEYGLDRLFVFLLAITANALMFFPIFFGLRLFYSNILCRIPGFDRYLDSLRRRGKPKVDRYGFWGLLFFVGIPLPVTGVYTATALAWLLEMDWRRAFPPIAVGVVIAGTIVLLGTLGIVEVFAIFLRG